VPLPDAPTPPIQLRTALQLCIVEHMNKFPAVAVDRREVERVIKGSAQDATRLMGSLLKLNAVTLVARGAQGTYARPSVWRLVSNLQYLPPVERPPRPAPVPKALREDRCPTHKVELSRTGRDGDTVSGQCPSCSYAITVSAKSPAGLRLIRGY